MSIQPEGLGERAGAGGAVSQPFGLHDSCAHPPGAALRPGL